MKKKGLVLAGGGSRGAYQIGVWRALRELGMEFQVVTGSSVGALNSALYVQGDLESAEQLWLSLHTADVVALQDYPREVDYNRPGWEAEIWIPFIRNAIASKGADFTPLEHLIREKVDEQRVRESPVDMGLVTVEYPSMEPVELTRDEIPEGRICDYLLGSAACFPAFRTKKIDGVQYIDGGYHDNIPINLAIRMGAEEIFSVDLDGIGLERRPKDRSVPVDSLESYWNLGPFLWFEPVLSKRNMTLGYLDTMKHFGRREGWAYTFANGSVLDAARTLEPRLSLFYELRPTKQRGLAERMAWRRMVRTIRRGRRRMSGEYDFWLASAEIAAEYLHVDPLRVYSAAEFFGAISEAWEKMDEEDPGWQAIRLLRKSIQEQPCEPEPGFWQNALLTPEAFITAVVLEMLSKA